MEQVKQKVLKTEIRGRSLLENPLLNKGAAFTATEREALGLTGLLPDRIESLDEQCRRAFSAFNDEPDGLLRHINLRVLQDTNETLFYAIIKRHLKKLLPYIYTPVVGEACIRFSTIFRRPRGLFITYPNRDRIKEMLDNVETEPEVIVVTDGDRILGLGDLGMNGLGICIGKLSLYSGVGGFEPATTLPVVLDVGTNNNDMLHGQNYLGWRHTRLEDNEYYAFVDQFLNAVKAKWSNVLLQFEDFSAERANQLLKQYRNQLCCFNDDLQGTAAVVSGSLLSAAKRSGKALKDLTIVIAGAGAAGCGIAEQLVRLYKQSGLTNEAIKQRLYLVDKDGLLTTELASLEPFQKPYAQSAANGTPWADEKGKIDLNAVIKEVKPNVLIGVTGVAGLFDESILRFLASCHEQPIILPLSNPSSKSEVLPEHVVEWTEGKALMATGSPFHSVTYQNKVYPVAQCNNIYIFPALGLGVKTAGASIITDGMLDVAAKALSTCAPEGIDGTIPLLPFMESIADSVEVIAMAIAEKAVEEGVASGSYSKEELTERMQQFQWSPEYKEIMPV